MSTLFDNPKLQKYGKENDKKKIIPCSNFEKSYYLQI